MTVAAIIVIVIIVAVAGVSLARLLRPREYVVGETIRDEDVTEFYYTYDRMHGDALYQRYRFFTEGGERRFFHETRRGEGPGILGEDDATRSGTVTLTEEQWDEFLNRIRGGTVTARTESADSGGSGPWEYLYWKGDKGKYQEYRFPSAADEASFEAFCERLRGAGTGENE